MKEVRPVVLYVYNPSSGYFMRVRTRTSEDTIDGTSVDSKLEVKVENELNLAVANEISSSVTR